MKTMIKFIAGVLTGFVANWMFVVYFSKYGVLKASIKNTRAVQNVLVDPESVYHTGVEQYAAYMNTLGNHGEYTAQGLQLNSTEAVALYSKVRILCCVFVKVENLRKQTKAIQSTWGRHCNKLLFFSSQEEPSLPVVKLNVTEGRNFLYQKTIAAFRYVYEHHLNDADFFLKADDDAFIVIENLRYFLSSRDPEVPALYGRKFKRYIEDGYMSGGAGYIISTAALKILYNKGHDTIICNLSHQNEDVGLGRCLYELNIPKVIATDNRNNTRMHYFDVVDHVMGNYPTWVNYMDDLGDKVGFGNISEYAISFHYIKGPDNFYSIYNTIYNIKVFRRSTHPRDLN